MRFTKILWIVCLCCIFSPVIYSQGYISYPSSDSRYPAYHVIPDDKLDILKLFDSKGNRFICTAAPGLKIRNSIPYVCMQIKQ